MIIKRFYLLVFLCVSILSISLQVKAEEPIKIAAIFAQTGEATEDNIYSLQGVRFAVDEINSQGGILGRAIKLLVFDNGSSPISSKLAAEQAVKEGVVAIIGAAWSSHSLAVAKVAQNYGIPMITNVSTNPDVTKTGNYIFRVCFIDPFQGRAMAQFVRNDLKAKTAVLMTNVSSDFSMSLAKEFRKTFEERGGKILLELSYIQNEKDFKKMLQEVKGVLPDILFIPGHDESGFIAKQAQEIGINAIITGGDGWGAESFFQKGGKEIKEAYYTTHWSAEIDKPIVRKFLQRYQSYNNIISDTVLAYDAVYVLANAINRAGSLEPNKIRDALAQTRNFEGLTGIITMNEQRDPIKSVVVLKIKDGRQSYLKTIEPF